MIYSRWWFSALIMLPSYVMAALVSSMFTGVSWILVLFCLIWVIGSIYSKIMIERIGPFQEKNRKNIATILMISQLFVLGLAVTFLHLR